MRLGLGPKFDACMVFCLYLRVISLPRMFAWTSEDMELFDLVEEINGNFYELLGLNQEASTTDIKKAYRRLSLQFHPDKNKEVGAEEKFRRIVAVSEVLKEESRRKQYDEILKYGLPDWRQPIYYYRRVRKLGLLEMLIFLFGLLTVGQYIVAWSMYWERKYELEEVLTSKFRKKKQKKSKVVSQDDEADTVIADHVNQIPKPNLLDLFPIKLGRFLIITFVSAPTVYAKWREESLRKPIESEEENDEVVAEDRIRKPRKRVKAEIPDNPDYYNFVSCDQNLNEEKIQNVDTDSETYELREWNEIDTIALAKAMNKFPGGTVERWEKIALAIKRPVSEVTAKAKLMKSSTITVNVPTALQGVTGTDVNDSTSLLFNNFNCSIDFGEKKPKGTKSVELQQSKGKEEGIWKQEQQKTLERAMQDFPKGTPDRWDRIAESVPGKSKEECIQRFKDLVDLVRKKKSGVQAS